MSKKKKNKTDHNEREDYYDIASARGQKKSKSKQKRRNTKDRLQDFKDYGSDNRKSQDLEDINDWYGDTLDKDW